MNLFKTCAILFLILTFSSCREVNLSESLNTPPGEPSNPIPADKEIGVGPTPTLNWISTDPDIGDSIFFDIYFGGQNPPESLVAANWKLNSYHIFGLDSNKTYFWKIVAKDNHGGVTESKVWRFTTYPSIPVNGLIAYYPFEGNANDSSGNGNNGILKGNFEFVNSIKNQGIRLIAETGSDSLGGHVLLPNFYFKSMSSFSYSLWIYEDLLLGDEFYISFKDNPNDEAVAGIFRSKSLSYLDFQVGANFLNSPLNINFPSSFIKHYIHYCLAFESDTMKAFINGTMIGKKYQPAIVDGAYSAIARHWVGNMTYTRFTGIIDEVRFYNRALTDVEVKALYFEPGL